MPGSPAATATVVKTAPSFLEILEDLLLERVNVGRQLQSLVRFWKESPPTGVQRVEERIRGGFEHTADFQYVR